MHVDGFRFDLATTLGRQNGTFTRSSPFFDIIAQDPVLSTVKLIAEPWDVGQQDSYDIGRFPALWSEWNGAYRDTVRDFWRGTGNLLPRYATRVTGSADLYGQGLRRPSASINFVTAHDGFTLADLVAYDHKHNEANGEQNRDGTDANYSWNRGVEGPTDDPQVIAARQQAQRTMLAALLTSFGVPMLLGGDELGRTQQGNNNAYCQDNGISWFDWGSIDAPLLDFTRSLIRLRREHPVLRRRGWLTGASAHEVRWFTPAGAPMTDADWGFDQARAVTIVLDGRDDPDVAPDGTPMLDDDLMIWVNAWWEPIDFTVPVIDEFGASATWSMAVDTAMPRVDTGGPRVEAAAEHGDEPGGPRRAGDTVTVQGRSMAVLIGRRPSM
jgi:glycogen operon protein